MQITSVITLLSIPFSFLLFLKGFFPLKDVSNGHSTRKFIPSVDPFSSVSLSSSTNTKLQNSTSDSNSNISDSDANNKYTPNISPTYKRVVLMIIDALRDDFVKTELNYLPKTIAHLHRGHGLAFTAQTNPPTVTLPRIKAITTGSIPGFIDVVLNFGSTALREDNIVTQMKINNKKIVFFGDDTWVNLFPDHFHSYDGTSSFFVTDFTEVDENVTRHLSSQLQPNVDWDAMILHYLGLDHIGHMSGPNSPHVRPKLREMDDVIDRIYSAMETWESESGVPSVLVICGDHGMSDQGGHGGSSPSEILVPLVFLSPSIRTKDSFNKGMVSQTDMCPTLSVLLGLPVPLNSLGKVIPDTLIGYSLSQKVSVLHQNAKHVLRIFKKFVKHFERESAYILYKSALDEHKKWLKVDNNATEDDGEEWERTGHRLLGLYSESLSLMAERVGKLSSQYDVYAMMTSITMLWLVLISILVSGLKRDLTLPEPSLSNHLSVVMSIIGSAFMSHIIMCTSGLPSALMCGTSPLNIGVQLFVAGVLVCCVIHLILSYGRLAAWEHQIKHLKEGKTLMEWFLVLVTIGHTVTLLSSSFVEEEHQTFYFITTSIHLLFLGQIGFKYIQSRRILIDGRKMKIGRVKNSKTPDVYNSIGNVSDEQHPAINSERDDRVNENYNSNNTNGMRNDDCDMDNTNNMEITKRYDVDGGGFDHPNQNTLRVGELDFREIGRSGGDKKKKKSLRSGVVEMVDSDTDTERGVKYVSVVSAKDALHATVSVVAILVFLRVLRRWNQTGDKWVNVPDFGDWLVNPNHKPTLSLVVLFSLVLVSASRSLSLPRLHTLFFNLSLVYTYMTRAASGSLIFPDKRFLTSSGVLEARASYFFIGMTVLLSLLPLTTQQDDADYNDMEMKGSTSPNKKALKGGKNLNTTAPQSQSPAVKSEVNNTSELSHSNSSTPAPSPRVIKQRRSKNLRDLFSVKQDLYSSLFDCQQDRRVHIMNGVITAWLCFMCLVLRPHNIPVVALMSLVEQMAVYPVAKTDATPLSTLLYCLWMGHAFFFFQGNSNSISTVDVSAGYVGLSNYDPGVIGLVMTLSTYSGLIFWLLSFLRIMCLTYSGKDGSKRLKQVLQDSLTWLSLKMLFPLSVYCVVVATQRYHLFVWTVFSPKLLYQAMETLVLCGVALGLYCVKHLVA